MGSAYRKLKAAIEGDLALYSSHLPLDFHPELGNNVLLAKSIGLTLSLIHILGGTASVIIHTKSDVEEGNKRLVQLQKDGASPYLSLIHI